MEIYRQLNIIAYINTCVHIGLGCRILLQTVPKQPRPKVNVKQIKNFRSV